MVTRDIAWYAYLLFSKRNSQSNRSDSPSQRHHPFVHPIHQTKQHLLHEHQNIRETFTQYWDWGLRPVNYCILQQLKHSNQPCCAIPHKGEDCLPSCWIRREFSYNLSIDPQKKSMYTYDRTKHRIAFTEVETKELHHIHPLGVTSEQHSSFHSWTQWTDWHTLWFYFLLSMQ